MTRQVLNLGDNSWYFGQVAQRTFAAPEVYDLPAVTEWLPATVPGNVRTDLLALDRIPDPFFGEGYQEGLWVEAVDWWYRRQLELDPLTSDQRAFLIFDGIDYLSAIFVDGQELARHEGMFSRQIIEITHPLRQKGTLNIAVRLWGSRALPRRQLTWLQRVWQKMAAPLYGSWVGIYPDRTATLKCQMSFGWDFAPPIRTMGLWDDVSLVITGPVFIVEASALGQPVLTLNQKSGGEALAGEGLEIPAKASPPEIKDADPQSPLRKGEESALTTLPADLLINLTLDADRSRQVEATIHITPANFEGATPAPFHFLLDLPAGRSSHRLECHLPEAALWQPWDRGQSHLYLVQITVSDSDSRLLDEITLRTGIRAVELDRWEFSLNGQREFSRGLNWVPADSFPGRLHRDDYARLLTLARQSGANLLRVWGGGLREKQAFYDLCDELGLLVWQEFPLACMFLGSYPRDPAYLSLVEAECGAIVRQLRHHPSVVLWGGGNEFSQRRNRPLVDTLATVVNQNDGTRPFIPVSPSFDHGRDAHNWHVWHGNAPIRAYQAETARFLSEFGLQALPHLDTLRAALPDPTTGWPTHHADLKKLQRYALRFEIKDTQYEIRNTYTPDQNSKIQNLKSKIAISQRAQATALQTAIEHMRRRKSEAGGVCLWQFNEPWPAISWAIVDYFGRPKLACERLSNWYSPILISLKFPVGRRWQAGDTFRAEIWAINDSLQSLTDCELQINLDGNLVHVKTLDLPADSARPLDTFAHCLAAPLRQISLTLRHNGALLAQNRYDLAWSDESSAGFFHRFRRWLADWVLRL